MHTKLTEGLIGGCVCAGDMKKVRVPVELIVCVCVCVCVFLLFVCA
jgi:hypothetical protein